MAFQHVSRYHRAIDPISSPFTPLNLPDFKLVVGCWTIPGVFLCMLAMHVEWHMRRRLAPMLFEEEDREAARVARSTPVEKARPSESARRKAASKRTADGLPVHSFRTLLDDLSGVVLNQMRLPGEGENRLSVVTTPTPVQKRAFQLLGVKPDQNVPIRLPT